MGAIKSKMKKKRMLTAPAAAEEGDENAERGNWVGKLDFVMSCIGYGVGIGDLLRFPYLFVKNGGGAFLVPFLLFLALCGFPLFYLEVALGQFSSLSCLSVWKICPLFKGIGWSMVIVSGILSFYYIMMIVWTMYYLVMSCFPTLYWTLCTNAWNTPLCVNNRTINITEYYMQTENVTMFYNDSSNTSFIMHVSQNMSRQRAGQTSAEEFWEHHVLGISSGISDVGEIQWQLALCLLAAWVIVFCCLYKGIKSSGRVVYVTVVAPYVLLTVFLIRGATLPGAADGVLYFLTPDWERLTHVQVWLEAAIQVFFSLGPAWGGLITMSSYNKFHHNCFRDAVITTFADAATGLYGGLVISCVLGYMAHESNVEVSVVIKSGPGLALVVYPEAISTLPAPQLWACLFFITLIFLGLDSEFGMFESVCSGLVDEFPQYFGGRKRLVTAVLAVFAFLIGLPLVTQAGMYIYQILDWYAGTFSVITIAFLECIIIGWIYGAGRFSSDIMLMDGRKPSLFIRVCWAFITPVLMLMLLVFIISTYEPPTYGSYTYPDWAIYTGIVISLTSILPIPAYLIWNVLKAKGPMWKRISKLLEPEESWGPALSQYREKYESKNDQCTDNGIMSRVLGITHPPLLNGEANRLTTTEMNQL